MYDNTNKGRRKLDIALGIIGVAGIILTLFAHMRHGFVPHTLTSFPVHMTIDALFVVGLLVDGCSSEPYIDAFMRRVGYAASLLILSEGILGFLK